MYILSRSQILEEWEYREDGIVETLLFHVSLRARLFPCPVFMIIIDRPGTSPKRKSPMSLKLCTFKNIFRFEG